MRQLLSLEFVAGTDAIFLRRFGPAGFGVGSVGLLLVDLDRSGRHEGGFREMDLA